MAVSVTKSCTNACLAAREEDDTVAFRKFRRQLFHRSLSEILASLRAAMTTPEIVKCPDGHFRRIIYGLGPYIADYPEQVLLGCVVTGWCARLGILQWGFFFLSNPILDARPAHGISMVIVVNVLGCGPIIWCTRFRRQIYGTISELLPTVS